MRIKLFVLMTILGGALASCTPASPIVTPPPTQEAPPPPHPPSPSFAEVSQGSASLPDVVSKSIRSVVNVYADRLVQSPHSDMDPFFDDPMFRHFFGQRENSPPSPQRKKSLGSGVIVDTKRGLILTNNHVVERAEELKVRLSTGRDISATIVGADPKSDLAVLKVEDKLEDVHALPLANSSSIRLGEVVLAIGNPFGVGQTVTMGIISAIGRADIGLADYEDFIQTDAAINPGNSGGALIDMNGELVGINTAILSRTGGNQGIGFAIPSNMAKSVMTNLMEHGRVVRGWLGVSIQSMTSELADAMQLTVDKGVLVSDVEEKSPAARAGIVRGDVIVSVDGAKTPSASKLRNLIASAGPNANVDIEVMREGNSKNFTVTLGELPESEIPVSPKAGPLDGMRLAPLNRGNRAKFNIAESVKQGVVIVTVERASAAARAGLRPGDVILELNRIPINDVASFQKNYDAKEEKNVLLIQRGHGTLYLLLES